jgi:DNA-binding MarR family transcriptional regulator
MPKSEQKQIMYSIQHRVGAVHDFIMVCTSMYGVSVPYRNGIRLTPMEAITVVTIAQNPGIMASNLCVRWRRSRGNLSQLLKKVEEKGLIEKRNKQDNNKEIALYPTDEGIRLYHQFMMNDSEDSTCIVMKLLESCTLEELRNFYKVIDCYTKVLVENPELQWGNNIRERMNG